MTNKEILKKAIEKAEKNGWNHDFIFMDGACQTSLDDDFEGLLLENSDCVFFEKIIFDHDFAKSFWGEGHTCWMREEDLRNGNKPRCEGECDVKELAYEYHLSKMVISKDPISYLKQFLTP